MVGGKSINLFLIDGDPNGCIKCTLANWTGLAYKIPRTLIEKCRDRDDLKQSGVYCLFGISDKDDGKVVYIGQAGARKNEEGILKRITEHRNSEEDYWTEAVIFTTSNNSLGPTEISYLENRFCNMARDAKRYKVRNRQDPTMGNITEEKESEMEEFIDYAKVVMGVLGHNVFIPYISETVGTDINSDGDLLYLTNKSRTSGNQSDARCRQTNEGFVVLKGSRIEMTDSKWITQKMKELRDKTADEDGILKEDVFFSSPSSAATFVAGGNRNGWIHWKNADGVSLKDIESKDAEPD